MEAKVGKYDIEIQIKIWSKKQKKYRKKIGNTNKVGGWGLDQTNPKIDSITSSILKNAYFGLDGPYHVTYWLQNEHQKKFA